MISTDRFPLDLRSSRQSLVEDGRRSRASAFNRSMARKSTRQSARSRSRSRENLSAYRSSGPGGGDRGSSGYRSRDGDSLPDSDNWDTTTDNNWTDYDQEVGTNSWILILFLNVHGVIEVLSRHLWFVTKNRASLLKPRATLALNLAVVTSQLTGTQLAIFQRGRNEAPD